jgi:hypothetical protein
MPNLPLDAQNYFIACYAVSLIQGDNILGVTLRSKTILNYINSAYKLFKRRSLPCPRYANTNYTKTIISAIQDYEQVPNRRNMITDTMIHWMENHVAHLPEDAPERAIFDWILLGRYAGFRRCEWCQVTQAKYERILTWPGNPAYAFIPSDFTFFGENERTLTQEDILDINIIDTLRIRWRKQKNKDNGQIITFRRDTTNPALCPVKAAYRIYLRARRLQSHTSDPLAVCKTESGNKTIFITDALTTKFLRKAACAAHNIPPKSKSLSLWSTHSIRVTAANLLHRAKFSDSFIQNRLRWKSNSFLMYLRNTFYAADAHTKGMNISDSNLPPLHERSYRTQEPHEAMYIAPAA